MVIRLDGWIVGWLDGWMVGWLDGCMVGWMGVCIWVDIGLLVEYILFTEIVMT